jgi:hypothetical protein
LKRAKIPYVLIAVAAVAGLLLRGLAATGPGGPIAAPSGYDDGVYFSASALLVRGILPYRDFVFVHPPGLLYLLSLVSWIADPATGYVAARFLTMLVGGANIVLAGMIAMRAGGPVAGVVAAVLYAFYPDAVTAERTSYLEPFLNLDCLATAWFWLRDEEQQTPKRAWLAGAVAGFACAIKFWGGIWVLAALIAAPRANLRQRLRFLGGATLAGLLLLLPLALPAPAAFLEQTLTFQLSRPPDGTLDLQQRFLEMVTSGHRAASVLSLIGLLALIFPRTRTRAHLYFAVAVLLTLAGFLASSSYWIHYNSHLAASQTVLAGLGAAALASLRFRRTAMAAIAALIAMLDGKAIVDQFRFAPIQSAEMRRAAIDIPALVPPQAALFAFDPSYGLAGGRLPSTDAPVIVDSYGAMLLDAQQDARRRRLRYRTMSDAFQLGGTQWDVMQRLSKSQYAHLGWRGEWQLNAMARDWFRKHFVCANPEAGDQCIWVQLPAPLTRAGTTAEDLWLVHREGWYGEEGMHPETWRWMGGRSVTSLPPRGAQAHLELVFNVPLDSLNGEVPTVTIELDGKVVDRFEADEPELTKRYTVPSRFEGPQTLVLHTDRTFVPARNGTSGDTRELGLSVRRLAWRVAGSSTSSSR